uniref:Uncharacterized protein n=1 Tax=Arundo donax TaxID=35708 RepID=A0A0A9B0S2_ARUDO
MFNVVVPSPVHPTTLLSFGKLLSYMPICLSSG